MFLHFITRELRSPVFTCFKNYHQGQLVNNERQYFYYIDHQGMLYLDDARIKNFTSCFKEKKFLKFFYKRVKVNKHTNKHEWPFVSPCGDEMNYIRCDDLPVVYHAIVSDKNVEILSWGNEHGLLKYPLELQNIAMCTDTGRVYHPAPIRQGGIGLIKSKLAIELSNKFVFNGNSLAPTHITGNNGDLISLNHKILELLKQFPALGRYKDME